MPRLNRDIEYLLWHEPHRNRWIATPVYRNGPLILDTDYMNAVPLYFLDDTNLVSDGEEEEL